MDRVELSALVEATGLAERRGAFVFLSDPNASAAARTQVEAVRATVPGDSGERGWLCMATGGSSGAVRFARHDENTLMAAVRGFCAHFGLERVNAVDVLPAFHVSGLMARVRCAATGGRHWPWSWKELQAGTRPELPRGDWVISLVPSQLQQLLAQPDAVEWLRRFRLIMIGGGPTWPHLAEAAAAARLPVGLSYGLTETAAMVAALRPEEFLAGERSCGKPLPHVRITIGDEGAVWIAGESNFRGYFPDGQEEMAVRTEDLGRLDERGNLHVLGRRDAVIITGGKKVHPVEVERALMASGEFRDVAVIGVPDNEWGEAVVAFYPAAAGVKPDLANATRELAGHQRPKRFLPLADWPRTPKAKSTAPRCAPPPSRPSLHCNLLGYSVSGFTWEGRANL